MKLSRSIVVLIILVIFLAGCATYYQKTLKFQTYIMEGEIEKARETMAGTIYLYEKLLDMIKPAVNPAAPFTRDPYAPFSRGT